MVFASSSKLKYDALEEVWDDNNDKLVGALFSVELEDAKAPYKVQIRQAGEGKAKHQWEKYTETSSEWPMFFAAFPGGQDLSLKIKDKSSKISGQYNIMLGALEQDVQTQGEYPLSIFMKNKKSFKELSGKLTVGLYYSRLPETRPQGPGPHTYSYHQYIPEMKTGDLIVYSGTGIVSSLIQLSTNAPYSHVGMVVKLPNKWTGEEELYIAELTKNFNGFQDAFRERVSSGVNLFRLKERIHQFHGNSDIWWVQQKQPLPQQQQQQMIDWLWKVHSGELKIEQQLPHAENAQLNDFLSNRFKIGVLNFSVLMDMYTSAFVYKLLCVAGIMGEEELARYPKGMLPSHLLQYGCFGDAIRIRAPGEAVPVPQPVEAAPQERHHRGHIRRHSSGASTPANKELLSGRATIQGNARRGTAAPPVNIPAQGRGAPLPVPAGQTPAPTTPTKQPIAGRGSGASPNPVTLAASNPGPAASQSPLSNSGGGRGRGAPSPRAGGPPPALPPRDEPSGQAFVPPLPAGVPPGAGRGVTRRDQMVAMQQKFGASKLAIKNMGMEEENPQKAIEVIVAKMRDPGSGIPIADINWHGKNYHRCFLGCDAIDWMVKTKAAPTRESAVQLATEILLAGKMSHISRLMVFIDGMELYRFEGDEDSKAASDKIENAFGTSLDELMQRQEKIAPDLKVPLCMEVMIKALYNLRGPETEGIFRVPCGLSELELARSNFNNGDYSVMGMRDAHLPACLLKLWLRELPDAPVPAFYYNYAINCKDDPQSRQAVLSSLPEVNQNVIYRLFDLLYNLSKHQVKTKMDISNLSMIFSPCLLRCPSTEPFVVIECLPKEGTFVNRALRDYVERRESGL